MLADYSESECTDPRDWIYSLLGLIDWEQTPNVKPLQADYTLSTTELAHKVCLLATHAGADPSRFREMFSTWLGPDQGLITKLYTEAVQL
jgi:hypothetical protein